MSGKHEENKDQSHSCDEICANEFYHAIMTEDLERINDISRKHGSNASITIRDGGPKHFANKGRAILPLHLAASNRRVRSLRSLLAAGADPKMRDQHGHTTLHQVIAHWPNVQSRSPKPPSKFQSTMRNMEQSAKACLQVLCDHMVNINTEVEEGGYETALHLAVRYQALPAVPILASHGAELDTVNSSGMTALHMASGSLSKELTASLIRLGADVNKVAEHTGSTPLHHAALAACIQSHKTTEAGISCITELLEHGAKPNITNKAGKTPLHEACSEGTQAVVELLLEYGGDVNQPTEAGENSLFLFLDNKYNVTNSLLLEKLLTLTYPIKIYNQDGFLPSTLELPQFLRQREQLINLANQPKRLQDICKINIYLQHNRGKRDSIRHVLPDKLYDFVFHQFRNTDSISFETEKHFTDLTY